MRVLAIGQSQAGNTGETRGPEVEGAYDLSILDGSIQPLRDPVLNVAGTGGSVWTRLAHLLRERDATTAVLFCSIAVTGTSITKWVPGGELHARVDRAVSAFPQPPTHILLCLGERDAALGMTGPDFAEQLGTLMASLRDKGLSAPVFVARSTVCQNRGHPEIREAQWGVAVPGAHKGPDTDSLGFEYRYDGCHFSTEGLDAAARLWLAALTAKEKCGGAGQTADSAA
jgi:hypothetical protein